MTDTDGGSNKRTGESAARALTSTAGPFAMPPPNPFLPQALNNLYINGFSLGLTNADANMTLLLNGQPQFNLSMSFTTAKTLTTLLNDMMKRLEEATGRNIMTTKEVEEGLKKIQTAEESKK